MHKEREQTQENVRAWKEEEIKILNLVSSGSDFVFVCMAAKRA